MTTVHVELSGETAALGEWESIAAAEALSGGRAPPEDFPRFPGLVAVRLPSAAQIDRFAGRLALARRCLESLGPLADSRAVIERVARPGQSAAVRRVGRPASGGDPRILSVGRQWVSAGGRIDLRDPRHRLWIAPDDRGVDWLLEERGLVDRIAPQRRRMPSLPFQRPVS